MSLIAAFLAGFLGILKNILFLVAIAWVIECVFPKGKVSLQSQLRALRFWVFAAFGSALAMVILAPVRNWLNPQPPFRIPLNDWLSSPWVHWSIFLFSPLLAMIILDFFGYWLHRAQHRWFWRQHSIHHSIEELSAVNSYFHWTEEFFRIAFIGLPAAFLVGMNAIPTLFFIELCFRIQGYYLHSQSQVHFGPIVRRVVADNRFHRIHHSTDPRHFDKNFGAGTSLWDQLFGTAYFPAADEWPSTGLPDQPEPRTLGDYLWIPFRSVRRSPPLGPKGSEVLLTSQGTM